MIHLTPEIAEATYVYLCQLKPFNRWAMPSEDDIKFTISGHRDRYGDCSFSDGVIQIRLSANKHSHLDTIMKTVAHEMVHVREYAAGGRSDVQHGAEFHRMASQVCRAFDWDVKAF